MSEDYPEDIGHEYNEKNMNIDTAKGFLSSFEDRDDNWSVEVTLTKVEEEPPSA